MIIKGLFELVYTLLNVILTPFQIIPDMPNHFVSVAESFKQIMVSSVNLLCYFVAPVTIKRGIPLLIIILNMEHIWDGILWILKKLPFVGIE